MIEGLEHYAARKNLAPHPYGSGIDGDDEAKENVNEEVEMKTQHPLACSRTVGLVLVTVILAGCESSSPTFSKPGFTADGQLERPDLGYREWVYIGTPLTPNELNPPEAPFPEFHNVYIHPADFAHWKENGTFPDGTVIIKELLTIGSKSAVSGQGYFMGDFRGLEAAVKDAARFREEPGNWAYFSFGHSYPLAESSPAQPVDSCNVCHAANADYDFVFARYYPVLRAAKPGSDGAIAEGL